MKRILPLLAIILIPIYSTLAQNVIFEDNFESYAHNFNLTGASYVVWEGTARASNVDSIAGDTAFEGKVFGKSDVSKNNFAFRKSLTLEAGKTYTWEIATKIQDGVKYFLQVNPTDVYKKVELNNADWQKTSVEFTVQTGAEDVTLVVYRWAKKMVSFDDFKLTEAVATDKFQAEIKHVDVYPNPTDGRFRIKTAANDQILIHDISGRLIQALNSELEYTMIDLSQHPKGIYLVSLVRNGFKSTTTLRKI